VDICYFCILVEVFLEQKGHTSAIEKKEKKKKDD